MPRPYKTAFLDERGDLVLVRRTVPVGERVPCSGCKKRPGRFKYLWWRRREGQKPPWEMEPGSHCTLECWRDSICELIAR